VGQRKNNSDEGDHTQAAALRTLPKRDAIWMRIGSRSMAAIATMISNTHKTFMPKTKYETTILSELIKCGKA
jgi:hypothetical protein